MTKLKRFVSALLVSCMMFSVLMMNAGAISHQNDTGTYANNNDVMPLINDDYDLTKATPKAENTAWSNLNLDKGDSITFTGAWLPTNTKVEIFVYRLDVQTNKYIWQSRYTSLSTNGSWTCGIRTGGIYKITVKPDYFITSGYLYATFK